MAKYKWEKKRKIRIRKKKKLIRAEPQTIYASQLTYTAERTMTPVYLRGDLEPREMAPTRFSYSGTFTTDERSYNKTLSHTTPFNIIHEVESLYGGRGRVLVSNATITGTSGHNEQGIIHNFTAGAIRTQILPA